MHSNHDVDPVNHVRPLAVDRTAVTLAAPGEPPLLLTHVPLLQVPAGWVNVHGHVHRNESPSRIRHINVSVEQLNYPAREAERHQAAGPPAAGRKNRPRSQHQGTAEHRGNHHAMTTAEAIRDETSLVPQTMGWTPAPVRGWPRWSRRIPT